MNRFTLVMVAACVASLSAQPSSAPDTLQARVTIDYRDAPAATVIGTIAAATGLTVEIGAGSLRPVTITLTNVKLGTALNAVCETASCVWRLQKTLVVTPVAPDRAGSLPDRVSFAIHDVPAGDVFRALATAINVPITVDPALGSGGLLSLSFKNARTAEILDLLCTDYQCRWDFDPVRGIRVTRK